MKKQSLSALLAVAYLLPLSAYAQQGPIATPVEAPRKIVKTIDFTKNSDVALFAQVNPPQAKPAQAVAVKTEAPKPAAPAKAEVNIVKVIDFTHQDPFAAVDYSGKAVNQAAAQAASQKQAKVVAQSTAIAKSVTYTVRGKTYRTLSTAENFAEEGSASWYGPGFHGRKTASGEVYNMHDMTAAHKHLPLGSQVKVTNLNNGKSVIVRINDRGPFHGDRVIDLSKAAAQQLGVLQAGVAKVSIVTHK